jgi:polysaccharide pyruvyl transferase WcaK-like protein
MRKKSVLLLGSYGRGNIGDDIFLVAAMELIANKTIYINCAEDAPLPFHIKDKVSTFSTDFHKNIFLKIKIFLSLDTIIYWGGDLWVLLYGDRFPRRSLYKMLIVNLIARLFRKKVMYVGVGIGDLYSYDLLLARASARLAHTIAVREQRSSDLLQLPQVTILPDLAINLPYLRPRLHKSPAKSEKWTIGISVLYHIPNPETNFPIYIQEMANFINNLDPEKYKIAYLPFLVTNAIYDDMWATQELIKLVKATMEYEVISTKSIEEYTNTLTGYECIIATRLHASILAVYNGVPSIGISYRPKVTSFYNDNGLEPYCIPIEEIGRLSTLFDSLVTSYNNRAREYFDASVKAKELRMGYQKIIKQIDQ